MATTHDSLKGKNVLVTGASTGIGRAIAVRFAAEGANVGINYSRSAGEASETERLCQAARTKGGHQFVVQADVADETQVKAMFARTFSEFGGLDVLINNSGILKETPSHELEMADFDRVVGVNLRGAFLCAREALRHFVAQNKKGVILNNSSVHQIIPKPGFVSYTISKSGMEGMTRTLALEYAGRGIRVNTVGPGAIVTPINNSWINDAEKRSGVESHIPMSRSGEPEEMAAVFAFLASDEASYITGQTIFACGGLTLFPEFRDNWST